VTGLRYRSGQVAPSTRAWRGPAQAAGRMPRRFRSPEARGFDAGQAASFAHIGAAAYPRRKAHVRTYGRDSIGLFSAWQALK
jgi:hypothetical protein